MNSGFWAFPRTPLLVLCCVLLLAGCATVDRTAVAKFQQGVTVVNTGSQSVFAEFNAQARELRLDRAATLPRLTEEDVAPGLSPKSIDAWNASLDALALYAASLQRLTNQDTGKAIQADVAALGDRIITICNIQSDNTDFAKKAVGYIGNLLIRQAATAKALEIATEADPNVRQTLTGMSTILNRVKRDSARMFEDKLDQAATTFEASKKDEKKKVAAEYVAVLNKRDAQLSSIAALQKSLISLADMHACILKENPSGIEAFAYALRSEVALAREALKN